jgi:hypothetical protein
MKTLKLITLFTCSLLIFSCSQNSSNDEQEIKDLLAQYDQATVDNNIAFFEKTLAADYEIFTPDGGTSNKAKALKEMNEDKDNPAYTMDYLKSDSIKVNVSGTMAVATGKWLSRYTLNNNLKPLTHDDEGRYTSILEKRDGKWIMVTEHISEKPHNKQVLETQLKAASDGYDQGLLTKDRALFEGLFADDYTSTGRSGKISNKEEDINQMTSSDILFLTAKTEDKNFRIYGNTAVETGRFSDTGTFKGKPFSETGRYTTTWIYRDGKWKIVADHTSALPESR